MSARMPAAGSEPGSAPIPASHRDLLERPICGVLTTIGPDGQPESSLVWVDTDGACARINTSLERRKGRNLARDARLSLLVVDPDDTSRFIQIRGEADLQYEGAVEHLNRLTAKYTGRPHFYGAIYPVEQQLRETRVICRIRARRITLDAIHA
jgi:PPOX class probable F420-dependent enzyme